MIDRRRNARAASHLVALFAIVASIFAGTVGPIPVSAQPAAPVFAVNGDAVGPVNVVVNTDVTMSATGLTPSTEFSLIGYTDANCSMSPGAGVKTANSNGEWTGTISFLMVSSVLSYEVVDSVNSKSNCITVNVLESPPILFLENDPIGPVTVAPMSTVAVHITDLTPGSTFTLNVYTGTTCTGTVDSSPTPSNDDGEYFGSVPIGNSPSISIQAIDSGRGSSNCITATTAVPQAPVLSINGDMVGPVTLVSGSIMTVRVTGLTSNTNFMANFYASIDCSGTPTGLSTPVGPNGEYAPPGVPFTGAQIVSFRMVDVNFGESNCVGIIVTAAPPPVLWINGDPIGPVVVEPSSNVAVYITDLTPSSTFTLNIYTGTTCSGTVDASPAGTNDDGEYFGSIPIGNSPSFSIQAVDPNGGTSSCVAVIPQAIQPPVLSINGDSVGPVEVPALTNFDVHVSGLSPTALFFLKLYNGSMCTIGAVVSEGMSDASGEFSGSLPLGGGPVLSVEVVDTVNGESNCVTVSATYSPPGLSVNGDSVGPVTFVQGTTVVFLVTDLPPNSSFTINTYTGAGCTGFPGGSLRNADANGEYTESLLGGVWDSSFQVVNAFGSSNCIAVSSLPIPPPVLSIDGDTVGPVELVAPATAGFHITGLTANTNFTLNVYNGTDCSVYADGGPNPADANGEFNSSAPYGGAQTVSYQAVDSVSGISNCVAVIVAAPPPPVLSIEGDSVGPVEIVSGTTADFHITGLTASTSFTLNAYNGTTCAVYADGGPNDADANGEFNSSAPYGGPQTVSYQAIDTVAGTSNCVAVIVSDAPTPTETPSPTAVPTETPAPTVEPTTTPEPTVAPDPIPDSTVNVTGDPRFPISGQVSIPGFTGLTFTLNTQPSNGTVTIQPDGTFTYSASSYLATFDSFTVLATAEDGETAIVTVNIVLVIDPTVPTYGEVGSGGTGYGDDPNDARNTNRPNPTAVPEADDEPGVEAR